MLLPVFSLLSFSIVIFKCWDIPVDRLATLFDQTVLKYLTEWMNYLLCHEPLKDVVAQGDLKKEKIDSKLSSNIAIADQKPPAELLTKFPCGGHRM